jgi:peptide/nickel transport system ATP-binding protein
MNAEPIIRVQDLDVQFDVPGGTLHAVNKVSFDVMPGQTLCIVGESGCGKTMTSLALMRLTPRKARVSARHLQLGGQELLALDERRMAALRGNRIGMIFQDPMTSLNPVYTIGEQMQEVYLRHRGGSRRAARARALELLERVGIMSAAARLGQYPHQLSGGLRQRVMIAMTLMCEPPVLIADEPTTALDVTVQVQILQLLADLQREFGMALILITHNLGVVARMADKVAVMYGGAIVETGTAAEVFAAPGHPYTQALLACVPSIGAPQVRLGAIPGIVPSLIGRDPGCTFRNRCQHARADCGHRDIELVELAPGRASRCVLAEAQEAYA